MSCGNKLEMTVNWWNEFFLGSRVSIVIPSAEMYDHLERLMVEGDLLEVTVDEKKMLRGLLRKFHSNYSGELFFFSVSSLLSKWSLRIASVALEAAAV